MCVALPMKLVSLMDDDSALERRGTALDAEGVEREVALAMVPEAGIGDYLIVHSGYAIRRVSESQANETRALFEGSDPS